MFLTSIHYRYFHCNSLVKPSQFFIHILKFKRWSCILKNIIVPLLVSPLKYVGICHNSIICSLWKFPKLKNTNLIIHFLNCNLKICIVIWCSNFTVWKFIRSWINLGWSYFIGRSKKHVASNSNFLPVKSSFQKLVFNSSSNLVVFS